MKNNQIEVQLSTDIKKDSAKPIGIKLMSRDINNNQFVLRFKSNGEPLSLSDGYTVVVLSHFVKAKTDTLTTATVYDNYAKWAFDTRFITQDDRVYNYVYVKKDGVPIVSADANAFYFEVGLSKIDEGSRDVAKYYDSNYEQVLHEFEVAINLTKDEWAQMADATRDFVDEIKDKTVDEFVELKMGEELQNLEANYATRLTGLESNDQNLTAQLAQTNNRLDGVTINAAYPPIPFSKITSDANYYNAATFKYYKDESMTIPSTDNKEMLQALVDFVHQKGGGTVLIPEGNFVFRSQINWRTKVSLVGAGKTTTRLFAEGVRHSLIQGTVGASNGTDADNPDVWFEDCTFKDFLIDNKGLSQTGPDVGGKGIFILYMRRALFRDLVLMNTLGTALGSDFLVDTVIDNVFTYRAGRSSYPTGYGGNSGIGIGTCSLEEESVLVTNCFTYDSGNYGIFVETQNNPNGIQSKYAKVVNCHSQGNKFGFGNKGSGGVQWIGNTAFDNRSNGFHLTQTSSGDLLANNIIEYNGENGIYIGGDYLGDIIITNNIIRENLKVGILSIRSPDYPKENISIQSNKVGRNGHMGVSLQGDITGLLIDGNLIYENGQHSNGYDTDRGMRISGTNKIINITNNIFYDEQAIKTQTVAIKIVQDSSEYIVDGNNFSNYTGASILQHPNKGVIGTNHGLITEKHGVSTIPDGQPTLEIVHGFGSIPSSISLTPYDRGEVFPMVWIDRRDGNMFRVRREGSTGSLEVYWEAKI